MRLSGKAATVLGPRVRPEDDRRLTGRGSGCGSLVPKNLSARAWPVAREVPAGWCTIPTGTLARGMEPLPLLARLPSPPFLSPRRLVMFATAWAPCLCASEARPSDRGIRCWGIRPRHLRYQPLVRRETVAAGRDFRSATTLRPGAGPASPDIASSGVSEGGTGTRVKREKWWGMKKSCDVDFVGGFLKVVPLFFGDLRLARGPSPPLRGRKRNRGIGPIRAKPQISQEGGSVR